jgi:hypothetical protein
VPQLVRIPFAFVVALLVALPAGALASSGGASAGDAAAGAAAPSSAHRATGGATPGVVAAHHRRVRRASPPPDPPAFATLLADGTVSPPAGAPAQVAAVIAAGNRIASLPYRWGGGHRRWEDRGYDCSGSVGYALHGGELLEATSDSSGLMRFGERGPGTWISIYANPDHVYMVVAGLRYDTSGADPSRWQAAMRPTAGYVVRHPPGL